MRTTAITALLVSHFTLGEAIRFAELLRFTSASATRVAAIPGLTPNSYVSGVTQAADMVNLEKLDLRHESPVPQAVPVPAAPNDRANTAAPSTVPATTAIPPGVAPVATPAVPPPTSPAPAIAPAITPAIVTATPAAIPPAPPTTAPAAAPPNESGVSITVQWIETWIGGTSRTWLPHTITLHNQAALETVPAPGKGQIGMGTITGRLGVTQTVIQGSAKTVGPEWKLGAMAAVGIGIAGMV